jgi:hypothetical protein
MAKTWFIPQPTPDSFLPAVRILPARALDGAQITMRFPRNWLNDWRSVAAGFDRLTAQLHPEKR